MEYRMNLKSERPGTTTRLFAYAMLSVGIACFIPACGGSSNRDQLKDEATAATPATPVDTNSTPAIVEVLAERQAAKEEEVDDMTDDEKERKAAKLQAEAEAEGGRGGRGRGAGGGGQRRRSPAGGSRGPGGARR